MKTICSPGYYHNGFVATLTSVGFEQSVCRGSLMTIYMYIYISGNKWFTTQRVLKFHRSKMSIIWKYMKSLKQCALPAITTIALWQLMHLETWYTVTNCWCQWIKLFCLNTLLVRWYQQCVTVRQLPKPLSCHKAIVVITRRKHCPHDCIYIRRIWLLWDLSTLRAVDHLRPLIYYARCLACLSTLWFIGTSTG